MLINPVISNYHYQNKPSQPKLKALPCFKGALPSITKEIGNVQFMDDFTIRLKEAKNLYDGVYDILSGLKKNKNLRFGIEDRLSEVLKLAEKKQFRDRKVLGVIGHGGNVVALELNNKEVLTMSYSNPFYGRNAASFDLPVKEQGYSSRYHYNLRPLADVDNITPGDVKAMREFIEKNGYKTIDLEDHKTHQVCEYNGKKYLLDAQCAYR